MTSAAKKLLLYSVPLAIVVATGILFAVFQGGGSAETAPDSSLEVKFGKDYYVFVQALEIAPRKPSGKSWDSLGGDAPDPYYEVHWRGNRIFASATQRDQLISHWSPLGVDTLRSIREGRLSADSVIKAAAMRATGDESFELRIYDDDPVSKDSVARLTFQFDALKEGTNEFVYKTDGDHSVTRLSLAVINAGLPLVAQVERILNPR